MMQLSKGAVGKRYRIEEVRTGCEGTRQYLRSLGCLPGEDVTLVSRLAANYVVSIQGARYSIDEALASSIEV